MTNKTNLSKTTSWLLPVLIGAFVAMVFVTGCGSQQSQPVAAVERPLISDPKISAPTPQEPGEEVGISVDVSSTGGVKLTYIWTADGGEIVRGQGSPAITYRVPDESGTYNVRLKVEWNGQSAEKVTTIKVGGDATATSIPTATPQLPTNTPVPPTNTPNIKATATNEANASALAKATANAKATALTERNRATVTAQAQTAPTSTLVPTQTPTKAPPPPPTATSLPGTETIPLTNMASGIPWLPMDNSAVPCTQYYGFNVTKPPFDNRLVRQAFALAVDRQAIANLSNDFGDRQPRAATTFTPPEVLGRDLYGQVGLPFNIGKAQELLTQAGFPNGEGLPPITLTFNNSEAHQARANTIATVWRKQLGANIILKPVDDWSTYKEQTHTDAAQVFRLGWCADYIDPDNFLVPIFHSAGEYNYTNFANAEFNRLVEQAATTSIPATRQIFYIQVERILVEQEAIVIPLYHFLTSNE